jgi:uncharacterized protein (TIGR03437 family)
VTYSFSGGAATLLFPTPSSPASASSFYNGSVTLNFSPDGNFAFGGSSAGFDMLVGVRTAGSGLTTPFSGLYYEAGADQDFSQYSASAVVNLSTYYGSLQAANGAVVEHERANSLLNSSALGLTFAGSFPAVVSGVFNSATAAAQYAWSGNGAYRIGAGTYPYLGLNVAIAAPQQSGSGIFLNPAGVINAASSSPFTAGISPGELISLNGTNLATVTVKAPVGQTPALPTTLGGVQVTIDGLSAPVYYVSPTQVIVLAPWSTPVTLPGAPLTVAQIQVISGGVKSNTITLPAYETTPGVFTILPLAGQTYASGIGYAAAVHGSGQLVTPANPALPGETVQTFLTGLGSVYPSLADGAAPSGVSSTLATITAGVAARESEFADAAGSAASTGQYFYAGLAPGEYALYQLNVNIPATAAAGDATLAVAGPDSSAAQAVIPVGGVATGNVRRLQPARMMDLENILRAGRKPRRAARCMTPGGCSR